jgi:hypothetical protein
MIENISCIETELQALAFRQLHGLAHIRVKPPYSRTFQRTEAERPATSGQRILQENLPRVRVLNCI